MNSRTAATQKNGEEASRFSRRLIELGEYAKREGITPQDVRRCSEIGVLQLRSHKGKTFVVDMPICSLENTDQIDTEVAELIGFIQPPNHIISQQQAVLTPAAKSDTKRILKTFRPVKNLAAKLLQNAQQALSKTRNKSSLDGRGTGAGSRAASRPCQAIQPGSISQLVQEMLRRAEQIEQEQKALQKQPDTSITKLTQTSLGKSSPMTEELLAIMHRQLDQIEQKTKVDKRTA
jgi:hypothetical protein